LSWIIYLTLQEKRQESDEEYQENGDDATTDPFKHGVEVVAPILTTDEDQSRVCVLADQELLVEGTQKHNYERVNRP